MCWIFFWGLVVRGLIVQMITSITENPPICLICDVWIAPVSISPGLEKASQKHRYTCLGQAKWPNMWNQMQGA